MTLNKLGEILEQYQIHITSAEYFRRMYADKKTWEVTTAKTSTLYRGVADTLGEAIYLSVVAALLGQGLTQDKVNAIWMPEHE